MNIDQPSTGESHFPAQSEEERAKIYRLIGMLQENNVQERSIFVSLKNGETHKGLPWLYPSVVSDSDKNTRGIFWIIDEKSNSTVINMTDIVEFKYLEFDQSLRIYPSDKKAYVYWDQSGLSDLKSKIIYSIYLAEEDGVDHLNFSDLKGGVEIKDVTAPPYIVSNLKNNVSYYMRVVAFNQGRTSQTLIKKITPTDIFCEEFGEKELNRRKWITPALKIGNNNGGFLPDNIRLQGGAIKLNLKGNKYEGNLLGFQTNHSFKEHGKYTGAMIASKDFFGSGSYEVKIKLSKQKGVSTFIGLSNFDNYPKSIPEKISFQEFSKGGFGVHSVIDEEQREVNVKGRLVKENIQKHKFVQNSNEGYLEEKLSIFSEKKRVKQEFFKKFKIKSGTTDKDLPEIPIRSFRDIYDGGFHSFRFDWHTGQEGESARIELYVDEIYQKAFVSNLPSKQLRLVIFSGIEDDFVTEVDFESTQVEIDSINIVPFHQANDPIIENSKYSDLRSFGNQAQLQASILGVPEFVSQKSQTIIENNSIEVLKVGFATLNEQGKLEIQKGLFVGNDELTIHSIKNSGLLKSNSLEQYIIVHSSIGSIQKLIRYNEVFDKFLEDTKSIVLETGYTGIELDIKDTEKLTPNEYSAFLILIDKLVEVLRNIGKKLYVSTPGQYYLESTSSWNPLTQLKFKDFDSKVAGIVVHSFEMYNGRPRLIMPFLANDTSFQDYIRDIVSKFSDINKCIFSLPLYGKSVKGAAINFLPEEEIQKILSSSANLGNLIRLASLQIERLDNVTGTTYTFSDKLTLKHRLKVLEIEGITKVSMTYLSGNPWFEKEKTWLSNLSNTPLEKVAEVPFELVEIDFSSDFSNAKQYTSTQILDLQKLGKKVITTLSLGKTDTRLDSWDASLSAKPFIGASDVQNNNLNHIRFWETDWLDDYVKPLIDRHLTQGFDGISIRNINVLTYWSSQETYDSGQETKKGSDPINQINPMLYTGNKMITLVKAIALYARKTSSKSNPKFLIYIEHGTELLQYQESDPYKKYEVLVDGFI